MTFEYGAFWEDLIEDLADPEFREAFIDASLMFMQDYHEEKMVEDLLYDSYGEMQRRTHDEWSDSTGRKFWVHKRNIGCDVNGCAIHNPSYHPLSDAKQFMREDKSWLIERVCDHGIGHPDPDSASFISKTEGNTSIWVHGCDGCCRDDATGEGLKKLSKESELCDSWPDRGGCILPRAHNMGNADIPQNHKFPPKAKKGWGPPPEDMYEGMTPDMFGYEGDY